MRITSERVSTLTYQTNHLYRDRGREALSKLRSMRGFVLVTSHYYHFRNEQINEPWKKFDSKSRYANDERPLISVDIVPKDMKMRRWYELQRILGPVKILWPRKKYHSSGNDHIEVGMDPINEELRSDVSWRLNSNVPDNEFQLQSNVESNDKFPTVNGIVPENMNERDE